MNVVRCDADIVNVVRCDADIVNVVRVILIL